MNSGICFREKEENKFYPVYASTKKGESKPTPAIYRIDSQRVSRQGLKFRKFVDKFNAEVPTYTNDIPKKISERIQSELGKVPNSNVFITGRTGMGKTLTLMTIADMFVDLGAIVIYVDSQIPTMTLRQYAEASNGHRIVFLFDDIDQHYGTYKGLDQFIAFLSDPTLQNVTSIITSRERIEYTRLNVVDGRPSRAYYRININNIVMARSMNLVDLLKKNIAKTPGKKWRESLITEHMVEKSPVTNLDVFNRMATIIETSESKEDAETRIEFLNKVRQRNQGEE